MEKVVFFSLVVSVIFLIFKFLEMKYIDGVYRPAREIIRDLLMVGSASFLGAFILLKSGNSVSKLMDVHYIFNSFYYSPFCFLLESIIIKIIYTIII